MDCNKVVVLRAMLIVSMLLGIACDSDSQRWRGGPSGDWKTDGDGDDDEEGESSEAFDDLFEDYDCANVSSQDFCLYTICNARPQFDQFLALCEDGTYSEEQCKNSYECYKDDYFPCFMDACPPGASASKIDQKALVACGQDLTKCVGM